MLAINADALDEDLTPLAPGFLAVTPERLLRRAGAEQDPIFITTFLRPAPVTVPSLEQSAWVSTLGSSLEVDAVTGDILGPIDELLLFQTVQPADIAALQGLGFRTFWGALTTGDIGGASFTEGFQPIPSYGFTFNVDFATGEVFNGHLFAEPAPFTDDFYQAFFDGQVAYANGNGFIDFQLLRGNFGAEPLDLVESEIEGVFAIDPGNVPLLAGSFYLTTGPDPADASVGGIFSVGEKPELRIDATDAAALDRLGITAFAQRDSDGLPFFSEPDSVNPGQLPGLGGLLLGRGTAVDPLGAAPFQLIANRLRDLPGTPGETGPVRADLFGQPAEFVQRQGLTATQLVGVEDVTPSGDPSPIEFNDFQVGWGQWSNGSTVQDNGENPASSIQIQQRVFFASVNPTPTEGMPIIGNFSYAGTNLTAGAPVAVLGEGFGDLTLGGPITVGDFDIGFDIDFATGTIDNGAILVGIPDLINPIAWEGTFTGETRGAVAELNLDSLVVRDVIGDVIIADGLLERSSLAGLFTGPNAERFVGGFSFDAADNVDPALRETVQGVFVVDQL